MRIFMDKMEGIYMRRPTYLLTMILIIVGWALPTMLHAAMDNYCSAPPYVTRSIAPNIMILMDNSLDMLKPAYTDTYTPNATKDNYAGYFKPQSCYTYSQNKFVEWSKSSLAECTAADCTSYTYSDTCPSAAPFRGNLLDWATTSKYDILEKVLIGGNSASKQGNAHTLLSISGDWTLAGVKTNNTYSGCVFSVNSANLTITEATVGACTLLDTTPTAIALWKRFWFGWFDKWLTNIASSVFDGAKQFIASAGDVWEQSSLVSKAWAAAVSASSTSLSGTVGTAYSITVSASGGTGSADYTWTNIVAPAWLTSVTYSDPSHTSSSDKNDKATWSGTPTSSGTFTLSGTVTKAAGETYNFSYNIIISCPTAPQINTTSPLTGGTVGAAYSFTVNGSNGITPYTWSATGLPAGLSIASSTGVISGTPTTGGTYASVVVSLTDAAGSCQATVSKTFSMTITTSSLTITSTSPLPDGAVGAAYSYTLLKSGGSGSYTWSLSSGSLPSGLSLSSAGVISGTPASGSAATYSFIVSLNDGISTVTKTFSLTITVGGGGTPTITTTSLPDAEKDTVYSTTVTATNGQTPYAWSASGLPAGFTIDSSSGIISSASPTQSNVNGSPYTVIITVTDNNGTTDTKTLTLNVVRSLTTRSSTFNVKVDLIEETLNDLNGNDIYDSDVVVNGVHETYTDANGNGQWDGKQGIFQKFWDVNTPKARWGLTKFGSQGATVTVIVDESIPAGGSASFYTTIQNATPTDSSPLAQGLYGDINYYGFNSTNFAGYDSASYTKGNSDPIDNVPCRKNFILVLSSGSDVGPASGKNFSDVTCTAATPWNNDSEPLVQNGCYGYNTDLRNLPTADTKPGKQNVYTYIVNTMGTANNNILEDAAKAGHGKYYDASNASNLEQQLKNALTEILGQAASGTAVSVLTTSSRGVGSIVQAYFLPTRTMGTRDVTWTGYMKNLWIDPYDNLREDNRPPDYQLKLDSTVSGGDKVLKLFYNSATNDTYAAALTTDANGSNGTLGACAVNMSTDIEPFSDIKSLWEAGEKLALRAPSERNMFTSTKTLITSGTAAAANTAATTAATTTTFTTATGCGSLTSSVNCFNSSNVTGVVTPGAADCTALAVGSEARKKCDALNADATFTPGKIVSYTRGECLETGVNDDSACGATANGTYRDRRITITGGGSNGNTWKLGDIISSTPKVFGSSNLNSYGTDYGDSTYTEFYSSSAYKNKSAVAFVGANDGMVHAFRVGYLKETGLDAGVKAQFQNLSGDTGTDTLGKEIWGYIPFNAFPYLKYLADPGYCHIYFNDMSVRLIDASLGGTLNPNPTDTKDSTSWKSILIGGMRFGGACNNGTPDVPVTGSAVGYSSYFAIDITDPENPVPLWEFTDNDLGYSTSFPAIIRTGATNVNGYWYVTFGSGSTTLPKTNTDIARSTPGYIYIVDIKTGSLAKKIRLDHNAIVGDIMAIDAEKDYISEKIYFGTTYGSTGSWQGKLVGISIPTATVSADLSAWTPASADIKYIFADSYPFTASPDVTKDDKGNIWIYVGSGKYYSDMDEADTSRQIFLGVKDAATVITYPVSTTTATVGVNKMDDRTGTTVTGTVTGTAQTCTFNQSLNSGAGGFEMQTYVKSISADPSTLPSVSAVGWYIKLPTVGDTNPDGTAVTTAERVITRPLAAGGLVDFLTYRPSSDACSYGGDSYIYAVGYTTGAAPTSVAISSKDITTGTSGTVTVSQGMKLGPGAPPTGEAIIVPPPKEGEEQLQKKIQIATGVIIEATNNTPISIATKIVHWLKK